MNSENDRRDTAPASVVEDEGRLGIFPSWKALYWTVVVYTGLLIAALQWMTSALDHSAR
jgi:hypothetical protein